MIWEGSAARLFTRGNNQLSLTNGLTGRVNDAANGWLIVVGESADAGEKLFWPEGLEGERVCNARRRW